jgi:hypothetical protein
MTTQLEIARQARDAAGLADHDAYIARLDAHTAYKAVIEAEQLDIDDIDAAHAAYKAAVEAETAAEAAYRKAQAAFLAAGGEGF